MLLCNLDEHLVHCHTSPQVLFVHQHCLVLPAVCINLLLLQNLLHGRHVSHLTANRLLPDQSMPTSTHKPTTPVLATDSFLLPPYRCLTLSSGYAHTAQQSMRQIILRVDSI